MNHEQIKFNQLKRDIKHLLEAFVSGFPFAENEKSLIRIIGNMEPTPTDSAVIQSCLSRIADQCAELDLDSMEYEAKMLLDRLEQFEFEEVGTEI